MLSFDLELARGSFRFAMKQTLDQPISGVFGPSGSGKTTLLHLLAGLVRPDRGFLKLGDRLLYDSEQSRWVPPHQRRIAVVFQESRLFPHLDVRANLCFPARYRQEEGPSLDDIVSWLQLELLMDQRPWQLSGGERQRVALGRALMCAPQLLLLDEPLASLDQGHKNQILPLLRRLHEQSGIPMLHVSHDLGELLQLTRHLMVVEGGGCIGTGHFHELLAQQRVLDLTHDLGLLNVFPAKPLDQSLVEGICHLQVCDGVTLCAPPREEEARRLFVALRPEDIALVRRSVPEISIQNQVPGRILRLMHSRHKALCLVQCEALQLLAEVTPHAIHELGLAVDQPITCLFKAQALRYL